MDYGQQIAHLQSLISDLEQKLNAQSGLLNVITSWISTTFHVKLADYADKDVFLSVNPSSTVTVVPVPAPATTAKPNPLPARAKARSSRGGGGGYKKPSLRGSHFRKLITASLADVEAVEDPLFQVNVKVEPLELEFNDNFDEDCSSSNGIGIDDEIQNHKGQSLTDNAAAGAEDNDEPQGRRRPKRSCTKSVDYRGLAGAAPTPKNVRDIDADYDLVKDLKSMRPVLTRIKNPDVVEIKVELNPGTEFNPNNPDFPATIQAVTEAVILAETETVQLHGHRANQELPRALLERERANKEEYRAIVLAQFSPTFSDGDGGRISGQTCKKCGQHFAGKTQTCVELSLSFHLRQCAPEVVQQRFRRPFSGAAPSDGIGRPSSAVWKHFTTTKLGGKLIDSFCKACSKRVVPRSLRLMHHLEICVGEAGAAADDDEFWREFPESKSKPKWKNLQKTSEPNIQIPAISLDTDPVQQPIITGLDPPADLCPIEPKRQLSHVCEICGKVIQKGISYMERHMVTHSKKRPFKCGQCGRGFNLAQSLKKHILVIHQGVKLSRKNPPIRRGNKRPVPIIIDESDPDTDDNGNEGDNGKADADVGPGFDFGGELLEMATAQVWSTGEKIN